MTMDLKQRQRDALYRYPQALNNTHKNYLGLLKKPVFLEDLENRSGDAMFILQYMQDSHKKYIDALTLLEQDKHALSILERLFDQITINPNKNLQGFIDEAHTIMQSKEFQSELHKLKHTYKNELLMAALGIFLTLFLAAALGVFISPFFMLAVTLTVVFFAKLIMTAPEIDRIRQSIHLLTAEEPLFCGFAEKYRYGMDDNVTVITIERACSTAKFRDSFFQPQINNPLHEEVQTQFNSLTK